MDRWPSDWDLKVGWILAVFGCDLKTCHVREGEKHVLAGLEWDFREARWDGFIY